MDNGVLDKGKKQVSHFALMREFLKITLLQSWDRPTPFFPYRVV